MTVFKFLAKGLIGLYAFAILAIVLLIGTFKALIAFV